MKISNAPVSYQTHVRPGQVCDMIRHCTALQAACDRLASATIQYPQYFLDVGAQPDWRVVAMQWVSQPEVTDFREAALNNHFVCANWKTFDQLQGKAYRSREALLQGRPLVPMEADFPWLRRFIHSVVTWERDKADPCPPTLRVAAANRGWALVASALQQELKAFVSSNDPWAELGP